MDVTRVADDIMEAFGYDGYKDEVTPGYKNLLGHSKWHRELTVNTPYGYHSDIHFYRKTRFFQGQVNERWGKAKSYKGLTVLTVNGIIYTIKEGKVIQKKKF